MTRSSLTHRTRRLALICGSAAVLLAPAALAQPGASSQPATTRYNAGTTPSILSKIEGVWRVDVRVNPDMWAGNNQWRSTDHDAQDTQDRNAHPSDPSNPTRNDRPANPSNNTNQTGNTPSSQPGDHSTQGFTHLGNFHGIAQTDLILGDSIMRERMQIQSGDAVMYDRGMDSDRSHTRNPGSTNNPSTNNPGSTNNPSTNNPGSTNNPNRTGAYQPYDRNASASAIAECLSFIAFDPDSNTYNAVFMNSIDGSMKQCSGTYDESTRKLIFHSNAPRDRYPAASSSPTPAARNSDGSVGHDNAQPTTTRPGAAQPTTHDNTNAGLPMAGHSNVRVELEMIGDDMFRVTMYNDDGLSSTYTTPGTTTPGSTTPGSTTNPSAASPSANPADDRPYTTPSSTNPPDNNSRDNTHRDDNASQPGRDSRAYPIAGADVIFQATYTRVSSSEAADIRRALNDMYASADRMDR